MKYIGKCEYKRKNGWKNYLGSGIYLKRAVTTYGKENFVRTILDEADTSEELEQLEEYYLSMFKVVEDPNFYNLKYTSIGGDTITAHPDRESRVSQMSARNSGERNPMYGKKKTEKMINSVKKANSKPITIDGVSYVSTTEASKVLGINITTICYRLSADTFPQYVREGKF